MSVRRLSRSEASGGSTARLPDMSGRTVIVTGASSGIGLVTARELATAGARVVLAVRDAGKGKRAATTMSGDTEVRALELDNLASVRAFASTWTGKLDILVNNAGIMMVPEGQTVDGFERHIGTNHLGHFALTNQLLPHITDRVITVSSHLHEAGRLDLEDLSWQRRPYRGNQAYSDSKLANLLFTLELQRRFTAAGSSVRAVAVHPGMTRTNLFGHATGVRATLINALAGLA
ncbi:MAG: SDR family NAD(P)-dependent oxidoreductase, partial [Pseudonocardiaceae bacterium]|nr:SDR family NAD(P)-dependent oxidoreductase [Pseudonocardiaceae bacterium]